MAGFETAPPPQNHFAPDGWQHFPEQHEGHEGLGQWQLRPYYENDASNQFRTQNDAAAHQERMHTNSLVLMFGDEPDTVSAMTAWSEQKLLKKKKKVQRKRKEKTAYGKKDKNKKDTRILNLPPSPSHSLGRVMNYNSPSRKKYSRGADKQPSEALIALYGVVRIKYSKRVKLMYAL